MVCNAILNQTLVSMPVFFKFDFFLDRKNAKKRYIEVVFCLSGGYNV